MTNSASRASATAGRSPAGSAWTRAPPKVPRARTCRSATVSVASAISGANCCTSGSVMTSWCVVMAPMTMASPSSRTPRSSATRPRSTTVSGAASRSRMTGINDWPPARTFTSSPPSALACRASSTVVGRAYSNAAGIMARLLRRLGRSTVTSEGGLGGGHAGGGLGLRPAVRVGAGGGAVAAVPAAVDGPPDPFGGQRHPDVAHPEVPDGVERGVHHRGRAGDGAGLADALRTDRVARGLVHGVAGVEVRQVGRGGHEVVHEAAGGEVAVGVVDGLLEQRLGDALGQPAVDLTLDDQRVDDRADVVHAGVLADLDHAGLGVDLHGADVRAVGEGEVLRVERRVGVDRGLHALGEVVRGERCQ